MKIENENTLRQSLADGINLFVGAGFSVLACGKDKRALPLGQELRKELIEKFGLPDEAELTLGKLSTILEASQQEAFEAHIRDRFTVSTYDPRYDNLRRIHLNSLFTTNVDDLLQRIFEDSMTHYLNDLDTHGPSFSDRDAIEFVALHGCVQHQNRSFTLSSRDIASAFGSDPDRWHYLTGRLQRSPTLVWGYSLEDAGTLEALSPRRVGGRAYKDLWIVLRPNSSTPGAQEFYRSLGFQIIVADTSSMLDFLAAIPDHDKIYERIATTTRSTKELFPREAIPEQSSVPVRPIVEFYKGNPPTWYEIFSGDIPRTAHFNTVRDRINSGKHLAVVGLAASGKTTLMMQVAAEIPFIGHKLVCDSLTAEKAKLIAKRLENDRALIFVDDFCDSIDACVQLSLLPNILIVGFDRDYYFEIISHRIDRSRFDVIDVTELSPSDIQSILSKIPKDLMRTQRVQPSTEEGVFPSFLEVLESNLQMPALSTRYRKVLDDLNRENRNLLDFMLVCCYVHSCRTPISLDMLMAYFGNEVTDFDDIYEMRDTLSSMVTEYSGEFDDGDQDYWVPRSVILAEAVIAQCPTNALNRVVSRFHKSVSPYRIHRYDVFRRRAFDKEIMLKAFPDWREGQAFYEEAYRITPSPFVLQQGALYLTAKKCFDLAFTWIDRANHESGYKIHSIRNSHAVILFKANINKDQEDFTVQKTLQESMSILDFCHTYDRRKTYHALVFADHSIQYWRVYCDAAAVSYLEKARLWLEEEQKENPYNRNVKRLLREVKSTLAHTR